MNLIWVAVLSVIVLAVLAVLAYEGFDNFPAAIEIPIIVFTLAALIFTAYAICGAYCEIVWMLGLAERLV